MDVRGFAGLSFDARGDGDYRAIMVSRRQRSGTAPSAPFRAGAEWREVRIAWDDLRKIARPEWSPAELTEVSFEIARPAGEKGWLELDNIRLWK